MTGTFTNPANAQIAASLGLAVNMLNAGQPAAAEVHLARILIARPLDPDGLHLLGLVRALQERHAEAEELYRKSLSVAPKQPSVQLNLGNALAKLGRNDEAIAAYREALRQKPDFVDAHTNLAVALQAKGDLEAAERSFRLAIRHRAGSLNARVGLGGLLNDAGRPSEAETVLKQGLAIDSRDPRERAALEHNLGVSLRLQQRYAEAVAAFDRAEKLVPDLPSLDPNRAAALQRIGRTDDAVRSYRRALERNPSNLATHRDLNALLYRQKRDVEFLKSYDEAAARVSNPAALMLNKGAFLLRCERFEDARETFGRLAKAEPASAGPWNGLALALSGLRRFEEAVSAYETSLKLAPDDATTYGNLAGVLLQMGEPKRGLRLAEDSVARSPLDQGSLAILDLALRANADARGDELADYDRFVQIFDLEPPEGFADMTAFNLALNASLDQLHIDPREHFDQTLRGGTQTLDRVFDAGHALADRLRARIDEALAAYIARMGDDETHPLFGRKRESFRFAGSWSSRLHDCGFHTNHIHPRGWISSCYYVAVPEVAGDESEKQGWLKLGEPSFHIPLSDPIRRTVKPVPGRLVLFPSYMWHGTIPFHSAQSRTTIAFDAVPD